MLSLLGTLKLVIPAHTGVKMTFFFEEQQKIDNFGSQERGILSAR
ncbi:TPA: hypothetical protein ACM5NU_005489 [Escherichia coli]